MPKIPTFHELERIEKDFDRRGDAEGKTACREKLYAELLNQYLVSPSLESSGEKHIRLYLRHELFKLQRVAERTRYTNGQVRFICAAAALFRAGAPEERTAFYTRLARKLKVSKSRVCQVFGSANSGGLDWLSGTWTEFRDTVVTAANLIVCD